LEWSEVLQLRAARDYFTLRDRLGDASDDTPARRFARALVQHAFNQPAASNATIASLLAARTIPESLVVALGRLRLANDLRLFSYGEGAAAADALLADTSRLDAAMLQDIRNTRALFRALAGAAPQTVERRGPASLRLAQGRVPLHVNGAARQYVFDTGANLSTLMRSEAVALGLRVVPAGIVVGSSTDLRVTADVAVADSVAIGGLLYRNVPFLVLDDAMLTFPGGFRIPGIVGFPVIEQAGEIRLGHGTLNIPAAVPPRAERNLALDELTLLTRARWTGLPLICRLDTGAGRTQFYEPLYSRARRMIDSSSSAATRRMGGAGGIRELPVHVLRGVALAVGDTTVVLDSVDVVTRSLARTQDANFLDCNIGHDVLDAFPDYVINFRSMTFLLQ
jgi:predicted aspartyl protease